MASHTPSILGRCGKLADATDDFLIKLQSGNTEKTQLYFLKVEVVNAYGLLDFSFYYYNSKILYEMIMTANRYNYQSRFHLLFR